MARGRSIGRWLALAVLLALLAWTVALVAFAQRVTRLPEPDSGGTDAIVALTGGENRLKVGIELLREGLAPRLFISGVYRGLDVEHLMAELREDAEGFECCIDLGYAATDTKGNARETADWVQENGVHSIRLVTSGYHMPRSLLEFHRALPDIEIVPHPVPSERVPLDPWYGNWRSIRLMATEFTKYLIVRTGG